MNDDFLKNKYMIVPDAIDDNFRNFLTQYALFLEMQNYRISDFQSPNSFSRYGDPAMETLLLEMQNTIENHTNLELYPTYSYFRIYRSGDSLKSHVDRESCEISATICLNFSYDPLLFNWAISFEDKDIIQKPGDMVIYKGCEIKHHRNLFDSCNDDWHIQVFLHYVDRNGKNKNFKYDQRSSVGLLKNKNIRPYITCIL